MDKKEIWKKCFDMVSRFWPETEAQWIDELDLIPIISEAEKEFDIIISDREVYQNDFIGIIGMVEVVDWLTKQVIIGIKPSHPRTMLGKVLVTSNFQQSSSWDITDLIDPDKCSVISTTVDNGSLYLIYIYNE